MEEGTADLTPARGSAGGPGFRGEGTSVSLPPGQRDDGGWQPGGCLTHCPGPHRPPVCRLSFRIEQ
jgi:hypothetical protein